MPTLKYTGTAESIQVQGYGHFKPGDEKEVDDVTAAVFGDQRCVDEGFEVTSAEPKVLAEKKTANEDELLSDLSRKEHEQERNQ